MRKIRLIALGVIAVAAIPLAGAMISDIYRDSRIVSKYDTPASQKANAAQQREYLESNFKNACAGYFDPDQGYISRLSNWWTLSDCEQFRDRM